MVKALLSASELDELEVLVRQHLRVVGRIEQLSEQAAQYDVRPAELVELEAEAERLRVRVVALLKGWIERLK